MRQSEKRTSSQVFTYGNKSDGRERRWRDLFRIESMATFRRRSDGAHVSSEARVLQGLTVEARDRLFEELDARGNALPSEESRRQQAVAHTQADATENMARDVAQRPPARRLTRSQLLVDFGRAVHAAFPDRADELMTELEERLPEDGVTVWREGRIDGTVRWNPVTRHWDFRRIYE